MFHMLKVTQQESSILAWSRPRKERGDFNEEQSEGEQAGSNCEILQVLVRIVNVQRRWLQWDIKEWSDFEHILNIELIRFADGLS